MRVGVALHEHLFPRGADGGSQRIARSQWFVEIGFAKDDVFRLQDDRVAAAFDVDRPAARAVRTLVGNNGVRLGPIGGRLLRPCQSRLGGGDLGFQLPQLVFAGRDEVAGLKPRGIGFFGLRGKFRELGAEAALVVFNMAEQKPRLGQLRGRLRARVLELIDAPPDHFHFAGDFRLFFRVFAGGFASGLQPGLPCDG